MAETVKGEVRTSRATYTNLQEVPVWLDSQGVLQTSAFPSGISAVAGTLPGVTAVHKFGRNGDIDAGTAETVWQTGGLYVFPSAAETLSVSSGEAADDGDPEGAGAHTLYIEGLDGNYESVSETVTLNGTAAVTTTSTFLRVHTAYVTAGSAVTANAGAITCTNSTSGDTMFTIPATEGRTQLGVYTIPAGKTGYMIGLGLFVSGLTTATVNLDVRSRPFGQTPLVIRDEIATGAGSGHQHNHIIPLSFTEKSDIRLDATSTTANTRVAASFAMYLVDN